MKYISAQQYADIKDIPRSRLTARFLLYVGAIIVKEDKILLCMPVKSKYPGWQLPGGKALWSESILECVSREVLEETGFKITPSHLIGVYQRETTAEDEEFLRIIYLVDKYTIKSEKPIDHEIKETKWFNIKDILSGKVKLQSQQILREIKDMMDESKHPMDIIQTYKW